MRRKKEIDTGKITDGDGNAGDGDETEVIESVEIADDFSEWRVPIYYWVLWLGRRCNIGIHLVFSEAETDLRRFSLSLLPCDCKTRSLTRCGC